jgi:hypothetical protein
MKALCTDHYYTYLVQKQSILSIWERKIASLTAIETVCTTGALFRRAAKWKALTVGGLIMLCRRMHQAIFRVRMKFQTLNIFSCIPAAACSKIVCSQIVMRKDKSLECLAHVKFWKANPWKAPLSPESGMSGKK